MRPNTSKLLRLEILPAPRKKLSHLCLFRGGGHDFVGGIRRDRQLVPVALDIFMDVGDSLYNVAEENRA